MDYAELCMQNAPCIMHDNFRVDLPTDVELGDRRQAGGFIDSHVEERLPYRTLQD